MEEQCPQRIEPCTEVTTATEHEGYAKRLSPIQPRRVGGAGSLVDLTIRGKQDIYGTAI